MLQQFLKAFWNTDKVSIVDFLMTNNKTQDISE